MMAKIEILAVSPQKGDQPFAPFVHLWLSQSKTDTNGRTLLSPQLMTEQEVDESVDQLISQLEHCRKLAKDALHKK